MNRADDNSSIPTKIRSVARIKALPRRGITPTEPTTMSL
jgi:hypothetical protein